MEVTHSHLPPSKRSRVARFDGFDLDQLPVDLTSVIQCGQGTAFGLEPPKYESLIPEAAGCHAHRIAFCAHSAGTHTECAAHVNMQEQGSMEQILKQLRPLMTCLVVHVTMEEFGNSGDTYLGCVPEPDPKELVVSGRKLTEAFEKALGNDSRELESLVVLTNEPTAWVFFTDQAIEFIVRKSIRNLLVDKVSIDREYCGPKMPAHRGLFSNLVHATVTENVRYNSGVNDGVYLLNLQLAPFVGTDAVPSRVLLFRKQL